MSWTLDKFKAAPRRPGGIPNFELYAVHITLQTNKQMTVDKKKEATRLQLQKWPERYFSVWNTDVPTQLAETLARDLYSDNVIWVAVGNYMSQWSYLIRWYQPEFPSWSRYTVGYNSVSLDMFLKLHSWKSIPMRSLR